MLLQSLIMRRIDRSLSFALRCGLIAFLFYLVAHAQAQENAVHSEKSQANEINAVWDARYQQLKSIEFDLTVTTTVPRGYYGSLERLMRFGDKAQEENDTQAFPEQDSQIQEQMKVAIDGERILIDSEGEVWNGSRKKFIHRTSKNSFDGQVTKSYRYYPKREEGIFQKQGFIGDGKRISDFDLVYFLPLKYWLGPLIGKTPLVSKVSGTTIDQGGPLTIAFDEQDHAKLWLDPARQFVVTRIQFKRGALEADFEMRLTENGDTWIPTTWQFIESHERGRVVTCEISNVKLNPKISPDKFEIEFPADTAIQDQRQPKKTTMYRDGKRSRGKLLAVTTS